MQWNDNDMTLDFLCTAVLDESVTQVLSNLCSSTLPLLKVLPVSKATGCDRHQPRKSLSWVHPSLGSLTYV